MSWIERDEMHAKILVFAETKVNFFCMAVEEFNDASLVRTVVACGSAKAPSIENETVDIYEAETHCARGFVYIYVWKCVHNQKVSLAKLRRREHKRHGCACVCGIYQRIWRLVKIKKYNFINFILFHFFIFEFVYAFNSRSCEKFVCRFCVKYKSISWFDSQSVQRESCEGSCDDDK